MDTENGFVQVAQCSLCPHGLNLCANASVVRVMAWLRILVHLSWQAVSNSLWAYAKLGYNPGRELLDCTARRAGSMLHQYTSQARRAQYTPP